MTWMREERSQALNIIQQDNDAHIEALSHGLRQFDWGTSSQVEEPFGNKSYIQQKMKMAGIKRLFGIGNGGEEWYEDLKSFTHRGLFPPFRARAFSTSEPS
jgi:hypothetical protein